MSEYLEKSAYDKLRQKIENVVKEYNEQNNTNIRILNAYSPLYYDECDCYAKSLLPDFKQYVIEFILNHIPEHGSNPEHELIVRQLSDKIYNLQEYFRKIGDKINELYVSNSYAMHMIDIKMRLSTCRDQTLYPDELKLIDNLDSHMTVKYSKEIELINNGS